jgi:transposase
LAGLPLVMVDPRNTSRECTACGHIDKANRKSQSSFLCIVCGFVSNADLNAARIISRRADVNRPYISTTPAIGNPKMGMAGAC